MNTIDQCHVPTPGGSLLYNDGFGPRCGKVFPCPDHPPTNGHKEWHSDKQWHRGHPIYYKPEDLKAGVLPEVAIEKLRQELSVIRGKLFDLRQGYGWDDRLDTPEHGITLVIMALHGVVEEMKSTRKSRNDDYCPLCFASVGKFHKEGCRLSRGDGKVVP